MEGESKGDCGPAEAEDRITLPVGDGEPGAPVSLGHFVIGRRLGGGGMGVVFEARDSALDRTVALKLVRPGKGGERARVRLLREAQALARLKHPNVVTVFEVGTSGDEVFIAMELVSGGTLREWMEARHGWREAVDLFLAIGRGLAAAHALGLVHRDIKPSNIFLDGDGAPKIGDFGLVSSTGEADAEALESPPDEPGAALASGLTTAGSVLGTPAYMPPEQQQGQRADARADQYSWCVTLQQALTGVIPEPPGSARAQPAAARRVPKRLRSILARGLAPRAADRYPSMEALLEELAEARRDHTARWLALGGAVAIAAAAFALARASVAEPCPPPAAQLDAVWGPARQAALGARLRSVDPAQGPARLATAAARIDAYARAFREQHVEACRATRVRGTQSDTLLDLRMRCLGRRFAALEEGVALLASAGSAAALDRAVGGLVQLPPLDECADTAALAARAPLPEQPAERAAVERLLQRVQQVAARERGGALDGLPAAARALVDEARALHHAPALAAALAALARVQAAVYDESAAEQTLRELTQVAAGAHDDRSEAFAWTGLVGHLGFNRHKLDEALALVPVANAAVLRAGAPPDLRSALLYEEGFVLAEGPHPAEALPKHEEARALLEAAGATAPGSPLAPRLAEVTLAAANTSLRTGDGAGAVAGFQRAVALFQQLYGPDSPDEALALHDLGEALRQAGKLDEALTAGKAAVRIREARLGASAGLASSLVSVATVLGDLGRWSESFDCSERAMQMFGALLPLGDKQRVPPMIGRSRALVHLGRFDEAAEGYDATIALMERAGLRNINLAITLFNRAELDATRGRWADAERSYRSALAVFEEVRGKQAGILAHPLVGLGRCLLSLGRPAEAVAPLERARTLQSPSSKAPVAALGRFYLDRALVEAGRDRARGMGDLRAAREAVAASGADPAELRAVDRWIAARK